MAACTLPMQCDSLNKSSIRDNLLHTLQIDHFRLSRFQQETNYCGEMKICEQKHAHVEQRGDLRCEKQTQCTVSLTFSLIFTITCLCRCRLYGENVETLRVKHNWFLWIINKLQFPTGSSVPDLTSHQGHLSLFEVLHS